MLLCVTLSSTQAGHDLTFVKMSQVTAGRAIIQYTKSHNVKLCL